MEGRYFIPGELGLFDMQGNQLHKDIFNINGIMFGINDCEDIWVEKNGYKLIDGTEYGAGACSSSCGCSL